MRQNEQDEKTLVQVLKRIRSKKKQEEQKKLAQEQAQDELDQLATEYQDKLNNDKKVYPSELNTKAIACRVPMDDYISFLNDSIEKGIKLNDWLLLKIYQGNNVSKDENSSGGITITKQDVEDILRLNPDALKFESKLKGWIGDISEKEIKRWFFFYLIGAENEWDENSLQTNRAANLNDIKNQITILANEKISNSKDRLSFRRDILELLKELE